MNNETVLWCVAISLIMFAIFLQLYSLLVPLKDGGYLVNDPDKLFKCVTNSG